MLRMIDEMIRAGLGNVIDKRVDKIILNDKEYHSEMDDAYAFLEKMKKSISEEQSKMIFELEAKINAAYTRARDLIYLAGARDAIKFMSELDAASEDGLNAQECKIMIGGIEDGDDDRGETC